jgi:hypothetical protein
MPVVLALAAVWLWMGLIPQLVLGDRGRTAPALLGELLAGPIGLARALSHRSR